MSGSKRKEKKKMENFWYRLYRFFVPQDFKASMQRGQLMGEAWKRRRAEEVKLGMEITAQKHSWLQKIPFLGVFFQSENKNEVQK
jgi:hypothetical protein